MENQSKQEELPSLGKLLKALREAKQLTLRDVEAATEKEISNAYLSQLENGKIQEPSPHILYSLAEIYSYSYEALMERAGYLTSDNARGDNEKHGRVATSAIKDLTREEEDELVKYLAFIRSKKI